MPKNLTETFLEVFSLLLPEKETLDSYPPEVQGRLYNLSFLIVGLLVGTRISAAQIQHLIEKLEIKPEVNTPGADGVSASPAPQGKEAETTATPGKKKEENTQTPGEVKPEPGKFSA